MHKIFFLILLAFAPLASFAEETPKGKDYYLEELQKAEPLNGSRFYKEFLNMLFALALILGVLFVVLLFFKKLVHTQSLKRNELSQIKVIEQRPLSPKSSLYLLELGGQTLLIAESPAGVSLLAKVPPSTLL